MVDIFPTCAITAVADIQTVLSSRSSNITCSQSDMSYSFEGEIRVHDEILGNCVSDVADCLLDPVFGDR